MGRIRTRSWPPSRVQHVQRLRVFGLSFTAICAVVRRVEGVAISRSALTHYCAGLHPRYEPGKLAEINRRVIEDGWTPDVSHIVIPATAVTRASNGRKARKGIRQNVRLHEPNTPRVRAPLPDRRYRPEWSL